MKDLSPKLESSPILAAYMRDLEAALNNSSAIERSDILGSIRGHILESIGDRPVTDEVAHDVLSRLGKIEDIVAQSSSTNLAPDNQMRPASKRTLADMLLFLFLVVSVALYPVSPLVAATLVATTFFITLVSVRKGRRGSRLLRVTAVISGALTVASVLLVMSLLWVVDSPADNQIHDKNPATTLTVQ